MSLQNIESPRFCTARRYSLSSLGKGSLRSRIKGSIAHSFLGSLSSHWSLNSKDGLEDFIRNDNGIRLDPLIRKRRSLQDVLRPGFRDISHRNRSFSESWRRRPKSGQVTVTQHDSPLIWRRSSSPSIWRGAAHRQNTPPWHSSPSRQRRLSDRQVRQRLSDRRHHRKNRYSEGDILNNSKIATQYLARNHRHSEGVVLSKYIEEIQQPTEPSRRLRKRCISEGDAENANRSLKDSPKLNTKAESKSNVLEDNENDYVETIISSLRRNSVTQKYRRDMLRRNGFYSGLRSSIGRNSSAGLDEHRYRNSYCGSFESLDSIDSWSSCNSIENHHDVKKDTKDKAQSEVVKIEDDTEFQQTMEDKATGDSKVAMYCPDIIAAHSVNTTQNDRNEETEVEKTTEKTEEEEETTSWIDSSYWNVELLQTDARPRTWSAGRTSSRRQRLRGLRARYFVHKDRWLKNKHYDGYIHQEDNSTRADDSFVNLREETDSEINTNAHETASTAQIDLSALQICEEDSLNCDLEYLKTNYTEQTEEDGAEFVSLLKDEITFCSGKHGNLQSGGDDVDTVFDAITKEASKLENSIKDLMVVFFVGKLLKKEIECIKQVVVSLFAD